MMLSNKQRLSSGVTAALLLIGIIVTGCSGCNGDDSSADGQQSVSQTDHSAGPDSDQSQSLAPVGQWEPAIQNADPGAEPGTTANGIDTAQQKVTLETVDKSGFEEVVKRHRGKVVFIDFWGTWCPPCLKSFPYTVALHHDYQDDGLRVISVALESEPMETKDKALNELKQQKATFDNLLSDEPLEDAIETFNIDGGLPEYWLLGRDGQLIRKFTNEDPDHPIEHKDIEKAIRATLGLEQQKPEKAQ